MFLKAGLTERIICGIVFTRGTDGATIGEIRTDFYEVTSYECVPLTHSLEECVGYLSRLPGLVMETSPGGAYVWFAECLRAKSTGNNNIYVDKEIDTRQKQQKPNQSIDKPQNNPAALRVVQNVGVNISPRIQSIAVRGNQRCSSVSNPTIEITDVDSTGSTIDAVPVPIQGLSVHDDFDSDRLKAFSEMLQSKQSIGMSYIGDDFLLSFINMEFHYKLQFEEYPLRCGHCVSGQTIKMALHDIIEYPETYQAQTYLINLGLMDILRGRELYKIEDDFKLLLDRLLLLNKVPICTTLPPVFISPDESHIWPDVYQKLMLFNRFMKDLLCNTSIPLIDLWESLTDGRGVPKKSYYKCQMTVAIVDDSIVKFALWNKLGRQSLTKIIQAYLE